VPRLTFPPLAATFRLMGRGRRSLLVAGLCALLFAGVATATVLTRHVSLRSGQCLTLAKTRVCAARARTRTVTVHRASAPITITQPATTVTLTSVSTVTVTVPGVNPPPTTTAPTGSPVTENFSGTGNVELAPFSTSVGETLSWTSTWPDGASIGDPNGDFSIFDNSQSGWAGPVGNNAGSGSTYLPAGAHQFSVLDEGSASWTIHVGP